MGDPKTVLIVEDEKNIVDILRFNLQRAGYQTLEAYDGEDGLAQAVSANPDLILLDVMLPKKNGFDVCRALRELKEETGAVPDTFLPMGVTLPSPGCLSERLYLFLARGLHMESQQLDEDEFLNVERIPFNEMVHRVMDGEIEDGKTIAAVLKAKVLLDL